MELVAGVLIGFAVAAVLALPVWPFSRAWGYGPAVVIGIVIIILVGMTLPDAFQADESTGLT